MKISKKIITLCLLLGSLSICSSVFGVQSKFYEYIKSISKHVKPLPLLYERENEKRAEYDNMMKILFSLMSFDDVLIIMTPDGDYTPFLYFNRTKLVAQAIRHESLQERFNSLLNEYPRVWVVIVDPRSGWQAQPPKKYASILKKKYMSLPLPMPTYFASRNIIPGSTNYWLVKANLLKRTLDINPKNRNPRLYLRLGQVYRRFGELDKAVNAYRDGIKKFPGDPFLHRELGECYYWEYSPPLLEESIKENRLANQSHISKFGKPKYDAMFNIAMAYRDLGEMTKSALQYNDILRAVNEFPNNYFESQTRRYLANVYLETGQTNKAIAQYNLDIKLAAQSPVYSYKKLIEIYSSQSLSNKYKEVVSDYYKSCGKNCPDAIAKYLTFINDKSEVIKGVNTVKLWMKNNTNLYYKIKANSDYWTPWTNAAISCGISPAEK